MCVTADAFLAGRGLFHGGRPLKRWRWVGVFADDLMACAAQVQIGPGRQTFWALHLPRETGAASDDRERTRLVPRRGEVELIPGSPDGAVPGVLRIRDRGVELDLELREEAGFEARCPNGRSEAWTRKQAGIPATGTLRLDGGPARAVDALAAVDDSAGYHRRETEWRWSTGVGVGVDGRRLAWNLVTGINDPPRGSERAVWVDGAPHEVGPLSFAEDLSWIRGEDGSELRFAAEAERSRSDNLLLVRSDYRAPFGTFSGTLPGGLELASGRGVMEWHRARW
ncbi:MAG TPA: DUF2804 family protein [Solirubrobacteraceae bacterium]|nr:DUF2804 family protein [Solirubrobacteraceae bacterium]